MTWLLSILGRSLWPILAAVAAALLIAVGVQSWRLDRVQTDLAGLRAVVALERAKATQAGLDASTRYRSIEKQMNAAKEAAAHEYAAAQKRNDSALSAARAGADRLRSQIAEFARGGGSAVDTVATSNQRAEKLGSALDGVLRDLETCARDAESAGDGVRALLSAWPRDDAIALPALRLGDR